MVVQGRAEDFTVSRLNGHPAFVAADRVESEMLLAAGLDAEHRPSRDRPSPTTFHVAVDRSGSPVAAACSTVGPLPDLPIGLVLQSIGVEVTDQEPLPGPVCELVSVSADRSASGRGVTEALYRSFYQQARIDEARSLVVGVDPWLSDLLVEQYGVPFTILGPPFELLGRELLAVGGRLSHLEAGIAANAPEFFAFLRESDDHLTWR